MVLLVFVMLVTLWVYNLVLEDYLPAGSTERNIPSMQKSQNGNTSEVLADKTLNAYANMDIYLRMTTASPILIKLYERVLVQSMKYFWPDSYSMVVVLDQEKPEDHVFGNTIEKSFPFPRICFMDTLSISGFPGKDRMQRDMIYPEKCISKKYVAFVDTDTMFITRIVPELLFVEGKPIVIGIYGHEAHKTGRGTAKSTAAMLKTKHVMKCMSYFPVIMKVEHVIELRQYLEKLHNKSVEDIFRNARLSYYDWCQYDLMCLYVWMFHRSEYHFRLQFSKGPYTEGREDPVYYEREVTPEQKLPIVRSSAHYKYIKAGDWKTQKAYTELLRTGICYAGGFELCPEKCEHYNSSSLWTQMFEFEGQYWTWDSRCFVAQEDHLKTIAKHASSEYNDIIRKACNEVETLSWSL